MRLSRSRTAIVVYLTAALSVSAGHAAEPGLTSRSAPSQYEALAKEYDTTYAAWVKATNEANHDDNAKVAVSRPAPLDFAPRFFSLAAKNPDDPAAVDALIWIASHCMFVPEGEKALQILASKYSRSQRIAAYVAQASRYGEPSAPYEELLRTVLQQNPNRQAQAAACISLATYLKMAKEKSESNLIRIALKGDRSVRPETLWNLNRLKERGLDQVAAEAEALFERAIEQYSDVRLNENYPQEAGKFAKEQLYELRNLSIGRPSLEFDGKDVEGKAMKLSDYRGQVVVLDFGSHKTCGVCRAMYPHLRSLVEQYKGKPVAFIGINAFDDLEQLKRLTNDREITWRVVWDGDDEQGPISSRYVIRSMPTIYVLDHKGIIRNKGCLDLTSSDEISGTVDMLLKEIPAH